MPTLSERHLVIPETRNDVGVFLQGDGIRDLDREAKKLYSHVRWNVGRERGRVAQKIAQKILQSTEEHMDFMDSGEYQQHLASSLIGELRDNVLSAIREVNALKNAILTKNDAEEQAMLEYLTAPERELWHKFKDSKAQKAHWETFMGSMKKPPATEPEALRTYEGIADGVVKKIHALDASLLLMQPSITELMARLNAPERKTSIS